MSLTEDSEDKGIRLVDVSLNQSNNEIESDSLNFTPIEVTPRNVYSVLNSLHKIAPLIELYILIARSSEITPDLQFFLSTTSGGVFLSISNAHPDHYLIYRSNLYMIVTSTEDDLICTLYTYRHQVYRSIAIKMFKSRAKNETTKLLVKMFLKELERDKYKVCSGAFTEKEICENLGSDALKSVLIEKFEESIVYRSRDCSSIVPTKGEMGAGCGTTSCEKCIKLKTELMSKLILEEDYDDDDGDEGVSNFVEVCLESDNDETVDVPQDVGEGNDKENFNLSLAEKQCNGSMMEDKEENFTPLSAPVKVKTTRISYKKLIMSALLSCKDNKLRMGEIYDWILERYPLFSDNKSRFMANVIDCLNINTCFVKVNDPVKGIQWTMNFKDLNLQSDWIPLPKKRGRPSVHGASKKASTAPKKREAEKPTLSVPSRYVSIAPKPDGQTSILNSSPTKPVIQTEPDEDSSNHLVIDEKNDSLSNDSIKQLPDNLKQQLKQGIPIILRPLETSTNSSTALPIIIQPSKVISLSPVLTGLKSSSGNVPATKMSTVSLLQRPNPTQTNSSELSQSPITMPISLNQVSQLGTQVKVISSDPRVAPTILPVKNLSNNLSRTFLPSKDSPKPITASVGSSEFPKPPFSPKELVMISIFYSPERAMTVNNVFDHVKLWFPYYRQPTIGTKWQTAIKNCLYNNQIFRKVESPCYSNVGAPKWTFNEADELWRRLIVSNKWFETPVDADLFEHMARLCPEFQEKVYSKKNMFKTVPISVKTDDKDEVIIDNEEVPASKKIKLEEENSVVEEVVDLPDVVVGDVADVKPDVEDLGVDVVGSETESVDDSSNEGDLVEEVRDDQLIEVIREDVDDDDEDDLVEEIGDDKGEDDVMNASADIDMDPLG